VWVTAPTPSRAADYSANQYSCPATPGACTTWAACMPSSPLRNRTEPESRMNMTLAIGPLVSLIAGNLSSWSFRAAQYIVAI